jgi:protein SCO1/2
VKTSSIFVLIVAAILVLGGSVISTMAPSLQMPIIGTTPAFELVDNQEQAFSSAELRNKVWVAGVFFTSCQATCPSLMRDLKKLEAKFADQKDLRIVLITVDPQYDTPKVLNEFARKYEVTQPRWNLLTGSKEQIEALVVDGFKLVTREEPLLHSNRFLLVDGKGQLRGSYTGTDVEAMKELESDLRKLL